MKFSHWIFYIYFMRFITCTSCCVICHFQGYGQVFIQKVQQKHVLARNYFSRLPGMAEHLRAKANDRYTQPNGPAINGQPVPVQSKAWNSPQNIVLWRKQMKFLLIILDTWFHLMRKICDIFDLLSGLQMSCVFQISCILGFNLNNEYLLRKPLLMNVY